MTIPTIDSSFIQQGFATDLSLTCDAAISAKAKVKENAALFVGANIALLIQKFADGNMCREEFHHALCSYQEIISEFGINKECSAMLYAIAETICRTEFNEDMTDVAIIFRNK